MKWEDTHQSKQDIWLFVRQWYLKMMLKRDKESVVGKLNPAGYPLIKIVVLVS